jgi:hypothetical protein
MKKFFLSIITVIYMVLACGVATEIHYCMGRKVGIELYGSESKQCGKCGMVEKDTGCCHDEHGFYKIEDTHKTVNNDLDFTTPVAIIENPYPVFTWQFPADGAATAVNNHSPPEYNGPSACILNCVFRI